MRRGRRFLIAALTVLAVTWLVAGVAPASRAEDAHGSAATKGAAEHKEAEKGPPIFLPIRIDLAIWTLVVFLLLLFVLTKYAWNPMLGALQKREQNIRSAIDEAQRARDEAHQIREQLAGERAKIADETRAAIDAARKDAQQLRETMLSQAKADIQAERERLSREIATAHDQALKRLLDETSQLATRVAEKVIRRQLTAEDNRRLVDEALSDLHQANGSRVA